MLLYGSILLLVIWQVTTISWVTIILEKVNTFITIVDVFLSSYLMQTAMSTGDTGRFGSHTIDWWCFKKSLQEEHWQCFWWCTTKWCWTWIDGLRSCRNASCEWDWSAEIYFCQPMWLDWIRKNKKKEREQFHDLHRCLIQAAQHKSEHDCPQMSIQNGITNGTKMCGSEPVGNCVILLCVLNTDVGQKLIKPGLRSRYISLKRLFLASKYTLHMNVGYMNHIQTMRFIIPIIRWENWLKISRAVFHVMRKMGKVEVVSY